MAAFNICDRCAHPFVDRALYFSVFPISGDYFSRNAQSRSDKTVFAVAVGRLINIHEIHVDFIPRNVPVKLGMKMEQRLIQLGKAGNPHFGR